jgi:uncharacterized protein
MSLVGKASSKVANSEMLAAHLQGIRQQKIVLPKCMNCERFHWYPQMRCPFCGSHEIFPERVSNSGRLFSWTEVHHAFDPQFQGQVPFTTCLVELDDAPEVRLVSQFAQCNYCRPLWMNPVTIVFIRREQNSEPEYLTEVHASNCESLTQSQLSPKV